MFTSEDLAVATSIPFSNSTFIKSLTSRGIDPADLTCAPLPSGWYGPDEESRRLMKIQCYSHKDTTNFFMKPAEGLTALVDIDRNETIHIWGIGRNIPMSKDPDTDFRYEVQKEKHKPSSCKINPIFMNQPNGPSFDVKGKYFIRWAGWEMHVRPDARAGVIISQVISNIYLVNKSIEFSSTSNYDLLDREIFLTNFKKNYIIIQRNFKLKWKIPNDCRLYALINSIYQVSSY
jgi:primary-amine oxidase